MEELSDMITQIYRLEKVTHAGLVIHTSVLNCESVIVVPLEFDRWSHLLEPPQDMDNFRLHLI